MNIDTWVKGLFCYFWLKKVVVFVSVSLTCKRRINNFSRFARNFIIGGRDGWIQILHARRPILVESYDNIILLLFFDSLLADLRYLQHVLFMFLIYLVLGLRRVPFPIQLRTNILLIPSLALNFSFLILVLWILALFLFYRIKLSRIIDDRRLI